METAENMKQNLKKVQESNQHVQKIIQSAQKLIKENLPIEQKQKMEVQISIEKQHLHNIFCNINSNQHTLKVEINQAKFGTPQRIKININSFQESNNVNSYSINYQTFSSASYTLAGQQRQQTLRAKNKNQVDVQSQPKNYYHKVLSEKSFSKITTFTTTKNNANSQNENEKDFKRFQQHKLQAKLDNLQITTPKKQFQILNTQQTAKKTILKQNTQKLQKIQTKKYTIHMDRFNKKKQQEKKRINSKSHVKITSISPKSKLYSSTLRNHGQGCGKCKERSVMMKTCDHNEKEKINGFDLAKKYLTQEGQKECYNFLKANNIPEKEWDSYITQYLYRQLSKVYNSKSQSLNNSRVNTNYRTEFE